MSRVSARSVAHETLVFERRVRASPEAVFAAYVWRPGGPRPGREFGLMLRGSSRGAARSRLVEQWSSDGALVMRRGRHIR
jgi:hypothetical protein